MGLCVCLWNRWYLLYTREIGVHLCTFFYTQWIKEDYKPVNISVAPSISCSLYTIIESLEKPQMEHPAQPVLNNNPPEVTAEVLKLSDDSIKNNCYLKTGHSNALEQSTQDIDSGSNCV